MGIRVTLESSAALIPRRSRWARSEFPIERFSASVMRLFFREGLRGRRCRERLDADLARVRFCRDVPAPFVVRPRIGLLAELGANSRPGEPSVLQTTALGRIDAHGGGQRLLGLGKLSFHLVGGSQT